MERKACQALTGKAAEMVNRVVRIEAKPGIVPR
jgi:hypothetical protein